MFFKSLQNRDTNILQALKKHAFRAYVYAAMAALNIALCIPLAKHYGEMGCALATAICLTLGSGLAINWYYAKIGLDLKNFFGNLARITTGILPSAFLILCVFYLFPVKNTWISLVWHGAILTFIYAFTSWFWVLNSYEKQLFYGPLKTILLKLRK